MNTAEILKREFPNKKYVVITSGYHMRRSLGCFQKEGIEVDGFSTDFLTQDVDGISVMSLVPSVHHFDRSTMMVREMVGMVVYKLRGYL